MDEPVTLRTHREEARTDRGTVLTKAVVRTADRLGLSARVLAATTGLSEATVSRMKRGRYVLEEGSKPFELAALLVRVFRSLDAIAGGEDEVARSWMKNPNTALGGAPVERIVTVSGLVDVVAYLDARRAVL